MATDYGGLDLTFTAGAAITAFTPVMLSADDAIDMTTGVAVACLGVAQEAATAAGDLVSVRVSGVTKCLTGGAVIGGAWVGPHSVAGECITVIQATHSVIGQCIGADAADATYAKIMLKQGPLTAT